MMELEQITSRGLNARLGPATCRLQQADRRAAPASKTDVPTRTRGRAIPGWEQAFAAFTLLFSAGTGIQRLRDAMGESGSVQSAVQGDPFEQAVWIVVYGVSLALLFTRCQKVSTVISRVKLTWLVLALGLVSVMWSETPDLSAKRVSALIGSSIVGLYLGTRYTWPELLRVVLWALAAGAVLSLAAALLWPSYGIPTGAHEGAWAGIFLHKNWLGRMMAFSTAAWLAYSFGQAGHRAVAVGFAALSAGLVLLSTSATGMVLLVILTGLLVVYRVIQKASRWALPTLIYLGMAASGIAVWLVGDLDVLVDVLGRDVTLSGRTQLWDLVWIAIQESPWLGYGYGGFWAGWDGPSAYIWDRTHWMPPHAHNGFLDLLLELGAVGMAAFIAATIRNVAHALALARRDRSITAAFPLLFLLFLFLSNITESRLLVHNSISWILYVAIALALRSGSSVPIQSPVSPPANSTPARGTLGLRQRVHSPHMAIAQDRGRKRPSL